MSVTIDATQFDLQLIRVAALLDTDPAAAARQAAALCKEHPKLSAAALLLGAARRACGDWHAAADVYGELAKAQPESAAMQFEFGRALAADGQREPALAALERAVQLEPKFADAWRELASLYAISGDSVRCDIAYTRYRALARPEERLAEARSLLGNGRIEAAESLIRRQLAVDRDDVDALNMLAQIAAEREDFTEAERLLVECLRVAPGFSDARLGLVRLFSAQQKPEAMLSPLDRLLRADPGNLVYRTLQSLAYSLLGENARALAILVRLIEEFPSDERVWMHYGHALRAGGRGDESTAAYRKSTQRAPHFAEAWFSLANLKTFRFTADEIATMQAQAARAELPREDRVMFEFALGKAREDEAAFAESFAHYERGNALRRASIAYDASQPTRFVDRSETLYTAGFFAERAASGCASADPIFIVGLPRSGSTLVEQILASHSQIEGTRELPYIPGIARELGALESLHRQPTYPQAVADLSPAQQTALGERYLAECAAHRLQGRARFIDKMPTNWMHTGLIRLILPKARIIDARRSALACCVANFKQYFQQGMWFSYSLEDLGRYYRDYARLMAHFDAVLPGHVHRVRYEELVADLEGEVRRLLDYCGLPFEAQCLRFHETRRVVQTVSSEQVRRPIYREALEQWRDFEPWLGPLKQALGDLADPAD